MEDRLRAFAKDILPERFVHWYRRRRAIRNYLRGLGFELYDRQVRMRLEDLEGRMAARREGFYEQLVKDVLERTELVLEELDRKLEGLSARHGADLRRLKDEVMDLRTAVEAVAERQRAEPRPAADRAPVAVPPSAD